MLTFNYADPLKYYYLVMLFILAISCNESPNELSIGENFIESTTEISIVDTFAIEVSTVILDTLIGNASGTSLVGTFEDKYIGKVSSSSYFQLGIPTNISSMQLEERYDSVTLVLSYNGYSYGDTTQLQSLLVYQLDESIVTDDNSIITTKTKFNYYSTPIGSLSYRPIPNGSVDTLSIKIKDDLGLGLIDKILNSSEVMESSVNFNNYFKGLVIKSDESHSGAIVGFNSEEGSIKLVLHTTIEDVTSENYSYEFPLYNYGMQFNNIEFDLSTTELNNLISQKDELSGDQIGGLAFLQGGIGLTLKVTFPTLSELLLFDRGTIMNASFSLSLLNNSFTQEDLPTYLYAYGINRLNNIISNSGVVTFSSLTIDEDYNEELTYNFDMTNYLVEELSDQYVDPENGIMITLPQGNKASNFSQVIFNTTNQNNKLKLYYVKY